MIILIKNTLNFLLIPLNVFWICVVLAWIFRHRKKKWAFRILSFGIVWIFITGTKYVPDLMVYNLERQYKSVTPDSTMKRFPIMVLGGGSVHDVQMAPQDRLSPGSLSRLNEGIRLYYLMQKPTMVFSGFSSNNGITQASITRDAAIALHIPKEKIIILEKPSTTEEEALSFKQYFGSGQRKLVLVTSDIHLPRAMYLFRKAGLNPIAAPADPILRTDNDKSSFWWISYKHNFDKFTAAMHEYIGILWAKI